MNKTKHMKQKKRKKEKEKKRHGLWVTNHLLFPPGD